MAIKVGDEFPEECEKVDKYFTTEISSEKDEELGPIVKDILKLEDGLDPKYEYKRKGTPFLSSEKEKIERDHRKKGPFKICDDKNDKDIPENKKFIFAKVNTPLILKAKKAGAILLWDLGLPDNPDNEADVRFHFTDNDGIFYDTFVNDLGLDIHRPIPSSMLNFQDGNPWSDFAGFDFYNPDSSDEDDYWSTNIEDYKLILWLYPLDNAARRLTGPCAGFESTEGNVLDQYIHHSGPDHPGGGPPQWIDKVLAEDWDGRIVIYTSINGGDNQAWVGYNINQFLNDILDPTGLSIDTRLEGGCGRYRNFTTDILGSDLTAGMTRGSLSLLGVPVDGPGEYLFRQNGYPMCSSFCTHDNTDTPNFEITKRRRYTVTVSQGEPEEDVEYFKDIVIYSGGANETGNLSEYDPDSIRQFYKNLWEVDIETP